MEEERGLRLDPADHVVPLAGRSVEQQCVDAPPAHEHRDEQVSTVVADEHVGPRLRGRKVGEHQPVHRRIGTKVMEVDVAMVRVAFGIAQVPEPAVVGHPRDRRGPCVGDRVGQRRARRRVDHRQRAVLRATLAQPDGHEGSVG